MSQENVEIVRRGLGFLRDSFANEHATDQLLALCAPEIRVDASRRVFNPAVHDGHDGVRQAVKGICEAWEVFDEDQERLIDAGHSVVVIQTISGRGRASQALVKQRAALIWTVEDGLVQGIETFNDPAEALKAVGLEE